MDPVNVTYEELATAALRVADRWHGRVAAGQIVGVYGVPRGGCLPAALVARELGVPQVDVLPGGLDVLVVDDLVDSGATARRFRGPFDALYRKRHAPEGVAPEALMVDAWLVFPWEQDDEGAGPADAVVRLLCYVGEDPARPGLVDTPARVLRALGELTAGYGQDPGAILGTRFPDHYDEMVILRDIAFTSLCEHHLLAFAGTATVAYIPAPGGGVVGLSKLARLVECFARRLQVQERLTMQVADALEQHLAPLGVGVVVAARHSCMACRGVRQAGAEMVTSALRGVLRDKPEARAEFLTLALGRDNRGN